jgi:hypothetical protein
MSRRTLFAFAVVAAAVLLVVLLRGREPPRDPPRAPAIAQAPVEKSTSAGAPTHGATRAGVVPPSGASADAGAAVHAAAGGTVVVRGAWGSAPGQFGRRRDPESNPEAPMAIAAGAGGELSIVDQVNRRVERFVGGRLASTLAIGGDTVQDIALGEGGRTVLLDRLADRNVQVYDAAGKLVNEAPLVGPGVPEGGGVTGVFSDDKGIYVEREHAALVRIADPSGNRGDRAELPGRPTRDGRLLVSAAIADRAAGLVRLRAFDRTTLAPAWESVVELGAPPLALQMLDSDRHGSIFIAASTGHESPEPPFAMVDEAIAVVRVGPGGQPRGRVLVPSAPSPDETFRPVSVDDDGNVYLMVPGESGLTVVRYTL